MKKIAMLYICTGNYSRFWKEFYESSQKNFLAEIDKYYFVFSDDVSIKENDHIKVIPTKYKGYPWDTLLRFEMFWPLKDQLIDFDFVYFFNANLVFVDKVGNEFLPDVSRANLVALIHPSFYNKPARFFPYERNNRSTAYIPHLRRKYYYFMGSLNGGTSAAYLDLIKVCMENVREDKKNGIIAKVLDESHLNRYLLDNKVIGLSPSYGMPEDYNLSFPTKILMLNKVRLDKSFSIRPKTESIVQVLQRKFKRLHHILFW